MNPQKQKSIDELMKYMEIVKEWLTNEKVEVEPKVLGRLGARLQTFVKENSLVVKMPEKIDKETLELIYNHYKTKIQPTSISNKTALPKINARLRTYTKEELIKTIDLFSEDAWWMSHNATRGATWFFNSDARTEQFLGIIPRKRCADGVYRESTKTDYNKKTIKVNDQQHVQKSGGSHKV